MYTKEQIEETCKNMPWLAYQQGLQDGYNGAFHDLRNQAAIAAMQSLIGNTELLMTICKVNGLDKCDGKVVAKISVKYADALILELRKSDT